MQVIRFTHDSIAITLTQAPVKFYRHGWQSWSLSTWQGVNQIIPEAMPINLYAMHLDPAHKGERAPHASHMGAVKFSDGQVLLLGVLGQRDFQRQTPVGSTEPYTFSAPEGQVFLRRRMQEYFLEGISYEADGSKLPTVEIDFDLQKEPTAALDMVKPTNDSPAKWVIISGEEQEVFNKYSQLLAKSLQLDSPANTKRVWSSWYSFYDKISENNLTDALAELAGLSPQSQIPFDVFQIDDGWQKGIGDWEVNRSFPQGLSPIAERIRAHGLQPGIWLAPLIATPSSRLYSQHPNWFLTDKRGNLVRGGFNFGEKILALDVTIPEVGDYLEELICKVVGWGFSYLKLDFLYAGALPGERTIPIQRELAYKQALTRMRNAARKLDPQAYILACGAPIIPSLGACDAIRIGPDVGRFWDHKSFSHYLWHFGAAGTRNAIRTSISRLWLKNIVRCDPDAAYFYSDPTKLTTRQAFLQQAMGDIFGFKSTSDLPSRLKPGPLAELLEWLTTTRKYQQKSLYAFQHDSSTTPLELDYTGAVKLPPLPNSLPAVILRPLLGFIIRLEWPVSFSKKLRRWLRSKL